MQRISCKTAGLTVVLALALVGSVQAQQQHQQHHPGGAQAPQQQPAGTAPDTPAQPQMMEQMQGMMEHMQGMMEQMQGMMSGGGMMGRRMMGRQGRMGRQGMGMMGRQGMMGQAEEEDAEEAPQRGMMGMGGMMQHHLERLAQQLELTEEQRAQIWPLLSPHLKEAIRLRADIETLGIDLRQLLEVEPVDLPKVKQALQTMASKEADLRFVHVAAMQEVGKTLTPEQRQKLRGIRRSMMGHGGMMGRGGMMGPGGMMGRGRGER